MKNIVCGKLDSKIGFDQLVDYFQLSKLARISAPNPNKIKKVEYTPFSTDGENVCFEGKFWSVDDFLDMAASDPTLNLIVLTTKEYFFISEKIILTKLKISILEVNFPIFDDIKYNSCPHKNLSVLRSFLKKIDRLGIVGGSLSKDKSSRHLYSIARKLRFKNNYDQFFFFAYREGYQETFKLKEDRNNRTIIALDFNSMFADCMKGFFCEPRSIYHAKVNCQTDPGLLDQGIYHVTLKKAKQCFFLNHHPFLFKRLRKSHQFKLEVGDSIEAVLHRDEIICYQKFFEEIEIFEGFCSKKTVPHPLYNSAVKLYRSRNVHRLRGNMVMANYCKKSIQLIHSSTNQRNLLTKNFASLNSALSFLSKEFALNIAPGTKFSHLKELFKKTPILK